MDRQLPQCDTAHQTSQSASDLLLSDGNGTLNLAGRTYATQEGLARGLGVTVRTLARWHDRRIGPPRSKVGNLVLYDLGKLAGWLESSEVTPHAGRPRAARGN